MKNSSPFPGWTMALSPHNNNGESSNAYLKGRASNHE